MQTNEIKPDQWARVLAEQLVVSLTGVGGKLNSHEENVDWTAAMILAQVPKDPAAIRELIEAAKAGHRAIEGALSVIQHNGGYGQEYHHWRNIASILAAAIAKVSP